MYPCTIPEREKKLWRRRDSTLHVYTGCKVLYVTYYRSTDRETCKYPPGAESPPSTPSHETPVYNTSTRAQKRTCPKSRER